MENLYQYLSPVHLQLEDILLDPNNPRFAELGDEENPIPEGRYAEPKVQRDALDKMKLDRFDVAELRDTIKTLGFLPMDKLVVREWKANPNPEQKKFVVIEGNRRVTALKWLLDLHSSGRETFSDIQLANFNNLEALLLDDAKAPASALWILPGLRHVSGIKEWGPYQKARAVHTLRESGVSAQEAAQSLGLSVRAANSLWRSYTALASMEQDEEFGEYAKPRHYSYFEEIFKKPDVRAWLDWNDSERRFQNANHLREVYSWIVGEQSEDGELQDPKLPEAKSIRDLSTILNDEAALAVFRSPNGTLRRALARYDADRPEDWQPTIVEAESILGGLSPDTLRNLTDVEIATLEKLRNRVSIVLADKDKLLADINGE